MRIEGRNETRRLEVAGLCAVMLLVFAFALVVPFLRHFYELATPTGEAAIAVYLVADRASPGRFRIELAL